MNTNTYSQGKIGLREPLEAMLQHPASFPPSSLLRPLEMLIRERQQLGRWGTTTYCLLMDRFVGDPTKEDYKPVTNPVWSESDRKYPFRPLRGVTMEGIFAVLRSTVPQPSDPDQCVAFTGDLKTREIRAWPVIDLIPANYYRRCTQYVLSRSLSVVLSEQRQRPATEQSVAARLIAEPWQCAEDETVMIAGEYTHSLLSATGQRSLGSMAIFHRLLEAYKQQEVAELIAA